MVGSLLEIEAIANRRVIRRARKQLFFSSLQREDHA
jgi:hypothetical protein